MKTYEARNSHHCMLGTFLGLSWNWLWPKHILDDLLFPFPLSCWQGTGNINVETWKVSKLRASKYSFIPNSQQRNIKPKTIYIDIKLLQNKMLHHLGIKSMKSCKIILSLLLSKSCLFIRNWNTWGFAKSQVLTSKKIRLLYK